MPITVQRPRLNLIEQIYLWEIAKGMAITLGHFLRSLLNPVKLPTLNYPEEKRTLPPNYRGLHRLLKTEDGQLKCTACGLCAAACPSGCITVEGAKPVPPQTKRYPARYDIDIGRCIFCGYCVEACPFGALDMQSGIYELADSDPKNFIYTKERLSSY